MRIRANPLVVAAALGLLGPAALSSDESEEERGIEGLWDRIERRGEHAVTGLGSRIEVIPVEDRYLLDDGSGSPSLAGEWSTPAPHVARQQVLVDGSRVVREFRAEGDVLAVATFVEGETEARLLERFTRVT